MQSKPIIGVLVHFTPLVVSLCFVKSLLRELKIRWRESYPAIEKKFMCYMLMLWGILVLSVTTHFLIGLKGKYLSMTLNLITHILEMVTVITMIYILHNNLKIMGSNVKFCPCFGFKNKYTEGALK